MEIVGRFVGVNGIDAEKNRLLTAWGFGKAVVISQVAAELMKQRIDAAVGEIRHADAAGIAPTTSAAADDSVGFPAMTFSDQQRLMLSVVDRVDDGIEACIQNAAGRFFVEKFRDDLHVALGVNRQGALGHRFGFLATYLPVHGVELTIDIGNADFIQIHEGQMTDARAGERLDSPRADTADADDGDPCFQKAIQRRLTIKPRNPAEAVVDRARIGRKFVLLRTRLSRSDRCLC